MWFRCHRQWRPLPPWPSANCSSCPSGVPGPLLLKPAGNCSSSASGVPGSVRKGLQGIVVPAPAAAEVASALALRACRQRLCKLSARNFQLLLGVLGSCSPPLMVSGKCRSSKVISAQRSREEPASGAVTSSLRPVANCNSRIQRSFSSPRCGLLGNVVPVPASQ